eukprot:2070025-Pleurochrysis_carterae.AAC.1
MQLRKASTSGVIWAIETIHQRGDKSFYRPAHIHHTCIDFHILQQLRAKQLVKMAHRGNIEVAGLGV